MNISKLTADMAVISKLPDSPTETAASLKAKFDQAPQAIGEYLNGVLVPQLNESVSAVEQAANEAKQSVAQVQQSVAQVQQSVAQVQQSVNEASARIDGKQDRISMGTGAPSGGYDGQIYIWY